MANVSFALVLNLHQPAWNLEDLLQHREWEAKEILWAIDRIPRSLWSYEDVGRVHLSLSGTLLEMLSSPEFQHRVYGMVDCGSLLWYLQNTRIIQILGTAYYHPVLPLIPRVDWDEQLERWQGIGQHLFNRPSFSGFWPPEMGFCMELIPTLKRWGYHYVLVDSEHVQAVTPMRWEELRYRPHIARFGGEEIIVVTRDRELSNAQEGGMEPGWFIQEVLQRTKYCEFPPLVTTCTDGENGGWFRNTSARGQLLGLLLSGPDGTSTGEPERRDPSRFHRRVPRYLRSSRRGLGRPRSMEHRLASWNRLHPMDRFAGAAGGPHQARRDQPSRTRRSRQRHRHFSSGPRALPAARRSPLASPQSGDQLQLLLGRSMGAPRPPRPRPGQPLS